MIQVIYYPDISGDFSYDHADATIKRSFGFKNWELAGNSIAIDGKRALFFAPTDNALRIDESVETVELRKVLNPSVIVLSD